MAAAAEPDGLPSSSSSSASASPPSTPIKAAGQPPFAFGIDADARPFTPPRHRFAPPTSLDPLLLSPSCNTLRFKQRGDHTPSRHRQHRPGSLLLDVEQFDFSAPPLVAAPSLVPSLLPAVEREDGSTSAPRNLSAQLNTWRRRHSSTPSRKHRAHPYRSSKPRRGRASADDSTPAPETLCQGDDGPFEWPTTPMRIDKMQRARCLTADVRAHPYANYPTPVTPSRYVCDALRSAEPSPGAMSFFPGSLPTLRMPSSSRLPRTSSLRTTAEPDDYFPRMSPNIEARPPASPAEPGRVIEGRPWTSLTPSSIPARSFLLSPSSPHYFSLPSSHGQHSITSHNAQPWTAPQQIDSQHFTLPPPTRVDRKDVPPPLKLERSFHEQAVEAPVKFMCIDDLFIDRDRGAEHVCHSTSPARYTHPDSTVVEHTAPVTVEEPVQSPPTLPRPVTSQAPAREGESGEIFTRPTEMRGELFDEFGSSLVCDLEATTNQCFIVVDGKWACYRRNYLKIDSVCNVKFQTTAQIASPARFCVRPPGSLEIREVSHFSMAISAHISDSDGNVSELPDDEIAMIQFGPARERGPREVVQPKRIRLGGRLSDDLATNERSQDDQGLVAAFRRIQIRCATLNNGQKGHIGQQYFALKIALVAHLAPIVDGSSVNSPAALTPRSERKPRRPRKPQSTSPASESSVVELACTFSQPITVRGRSKMHYGPSTETKAGRPVEQRPDCSSGDAAAVPRRAIGAGPVRSSVAVGGTSTARAPMDFASATFAAGTGNDRTSSKSEASSSSGSEYSFDDDFLPLPSPALSLQAQPMPSVLRPAPSPASSFCRSVMDIRNVL